jgi:hypothetical protein
MPLVMPLLAEPGSISLIILMAESTGGVGRHVSGIAVVLLVSVLSRAILLSAGPYQRRLNGKPGGESGKRVREVNSVDGLLVSLLGLLPLHCRIGPDAKLGDPVRPSGAVFIAWASHWAGRSRQIPACLPEKYGRSCVLPVKVRQIAGIWPI